MANDLVVRLNGDSKGFETAINSAKQSLQGLKQEGSKLDDFQSRFDKITNSTKPMKKQLADLRGLLAEMNKEGLNTTDVFTKVAQEAGSLADNIGDAQTAVKAFSDDCFNLQASAQAFEVVAAGGALVTGAMAMMGVESEKATEIIAKVQGAIALLNGVQTISNLLNKDSALMLKLKQVRMKINEAQTKKNTIAQTANNISETTGTATKVGATAATTANTVATVANTTSTTANTVAQNAWNVAKAIGKALLGDFSGLVLLAAGGLATYAIATANSTDKTKENTDAVEKQTTAVERQKERMKKYSETVASSASSMITSFKMLQSQWKQLATENEKIKWIEQNQEAFRKLGIQINSVTDAEKAFIKNSKSMVEALMLRASQNSLADLMQSYVDDYVKAQQWINSTVAGGGYKYYAIAGKEYSGNEEAMRAMKIAMKRNGDTAPNGEPMNVNGKYYTMQHGNFVMTEYGASEASKILKEEADQRKKANQEAADKALQEGQRYVENLAESLRQKLEALGISDIFITTPETQTPTIPNQTPTTPTKPENPPQEGSLEYWRNLRSAQEKVLSTTPQDSEAFNKALTLWKQYNEQVVTLEANLDKLKGKTQEEIALIVGSLPELNKQIDEAKKKLNEFTMDTPQEVVDAQLKLIRDLQKERDDLAERLKIELDKVQYHYTIEPAEEPEEITKNSIWDKRASLQNAQSIISQTKSDLKNGIITQEEAQSIIDDINSKLAELGLKPLDLKINVDTNEIEDKLERFQNKWENITNVSDSIETIGSAFSTLGNAIEGTTGQVIAFGGTVISQGAQMVSQLAQIIVANQAAALAQGVSSASGLMFPFNLAAIATVVATIASIFASLPKFAEGGIISGNSYSGDRILARVNSGEMIINKTDQQKLWNAISNGNFGSGKGGTVNFKIKGQELVGVLQNYNSKMSKIR